MPFLDCRLSNDLVANRLDWRVVGDCWFVGEVTKSPVEFHRFPSPVGLLVPLWFRRLDAEDCDCKPLVVLLSCKGAVECTVAGRGSGDCAGEVLLWLSAECSEPFDWWCNDRRFKFVFELFGNLEGELVVLLAVLPLLLSRQSPSSVVVICVERTETCKDIDLLELSNKKLNFTKSIFYHP